MKNKLRIIFIILIAAIAFYWLPSIFFGLPIPRGTKVCADYSSYYKNWNGIYYISVDNALNLITHGHWGYLKGVDEETFTVLDDNWAKDSSTVWYMDKAISEADAYSFYVDKSGLPKDKNHVYVYDTEISSMRPTECNIDVETAEYFVHKQSGLNSSWMRDKDFVYLDETKLDVDRQTFAPLGNSYWWTDKNYVYSDGYDSSTKSTVLIKVDSLQTPLYTLNDGCHYLRNGRNIIYMGMVSIRDIDVVRFEEVGLSKCIVNDMLLYNGEQILKDSLDIPTAKFYFYGHIAADRHHVFYGRKQLDDIDATTFCQINDEVFVDKNYIYTIKENAWREAYPFDKKRKE